MGTGGPFPGGKVWPGREADHLPHLVPRSRMSTSYTSSPPLRPRRCVVGLLKLLLDSFFWQVLHEECMTHVVKSHLWCDSLKFQFWVRLAVPVRIVAKEEHKVCLWRSHRNKNQGVWRAMTGPWRGDDCQWRQAAHSMGRDCVQMWRHAEQPHRTSLNETFNCMKF
jgi:hypothetical protein